MNKKVEIKIDDTLYLAEEGENILSFCKTVGIDIPALCYNEALKPYGACRLCVVEVKKATGARPGITASCTLKAEDGLELVTQTEEINKHRKVLFQFYLAQAPESEVIHNLAAKYGVNDTPFTPKRKVNDNLGNQCILCGQCVRVCNEIIEKGVIHYIGRGYFVKIDTAYNMPSDICMGCKACAEVCPTGAIHFEDIEDKRYGHSWSETIIPLKVCSVCGEYYSPQPFDENTLLKMNPELENELKNMCPACRRKHMSRKHVAIKENRFGILNLK